MSLPSLSPLFSPAGVAVIGASHHPGKLGYNLARNLIESHYQGAIHFVNPNGGSLMGTPFYPNIQSVPDPVELAVILVPAAHVPQVLVECGQRGVRAAIVASGGFREIGPSGNALEQECLGTARRMGIRLVGPNCVGLINTHLPMDTTFFPPIKTPVGEVAFISHSGGMCLVVIDWACLNGFGLSHLVSLGNQVDVNETDVLAPIAADAHARVLALYLEEVRGGRRFVEEARRVGLEKPIVALKAGRSASGKRAVASHTGALAGEDHIYAAVFEKAGVIRANTTQELFDWARALAWCPLPEGRAVAILGNAGGPGVAAADAVDRYGMQLADFKAETRTALGARLPAAASLNNPVDMLASASPEQYAGCLRILLDDPGVNGVLVILPPPPSYPARTVAQALVPVIRTASKPVVLALIGGAMVLEAAEEFRKAQIPEYRFPEQAASALSILAQRAEFLKRCRDNTPAPFRPDLHRLRALLQHQENGWLPQDINSQILAAYAIPCPPIRLAHSAQEAVAAYEEFARVAPGRRVVLKVASADIPHKSDAGGVVLNLSGNEMVSTAYEQIMEKVHLTLPQARIEGVLVQAMIPPGQDVILGALQDDAFGGIMMFGSGGVEVEGLKDVAFALAPLSSEEAEQMLESTWAGRKLKGYRNIPAADRRCVIAALIRLSRLAADLPELKEIEINPLRALPMGQGVVGIDARIRLERSL